jgi:hypothetical protein
LSATVHTLRGRQISAMAVRSTSFSNGLVGVSTQISLVCGRIPPRPVASPTYQPNSPRARPKDCGPARTAGTSHHRDHPWQLSERPGRGIRARWRSPPFRRQRQIRRCRFRDRRDNAPKPLAWDWGPGIALVDPGAFLSVSRGSVDRRRDRASSRIGLAATVDCTGCKSVSVVSSNRQVTL